ncbi:MAG: glucokinase [Desulfobulbaceae bacterium]|nr:glucokinase [Desulfobulbaceae bacterium]MCK5545374.1 glucokinase [Desulfobulbaceae bacterium]
MDSDFFLAGDIGGTKTTLALFSKGADLNEPVARTTLLSRNYSGLEAMVDEFLCRTDFDVKEACFGVAGPVVSGHAGISNLPWVIDEKRLVEVFGFSCVRLVNDLMAIANSIPLLGPNDLITLNQGDEVEEGAVAVIAPGTGLGEAFLVWDGERYRAFASEGGHTDFAPINDLESELLGFMKSRFDHVSYERLCSGIGFPNIYAFLRENGYGDEPAWLTGRLADADDPVPIIVDAALDDENPCVLCKTALNTFVSILGSEAGNLALKTLSLGGLYLAGGISPRILPALKTDLFMKAFTRKGRMSDLLGNMPVHVILNPDAPLIGAAAFVELGIRD